MAKRFMNLTQAQENALGLIAINQHPYAHPKTIQVLLDKGLITKSQKTIYGKGGTAIDRIPMTIDCYEMPLPIHYQWCKWCSEQPENVEELVNERTKDKE